MSIAYFIQIIKMEFRSLLALIFIFLPMVPNADAAEDVLDGPAITPAGENVSYVIDAIFASDEAARKAVQNSSVFADNLAINHWEISKSKNIAAVIMSNPSGQRGEIWMDGPLKLVRPPEGTGFYVDEDPPDRDRFRLDFGKYGYCHGSWISSENYIGKVKFNGAESLYFCEPKPPKVASSKSPSAPPLKEAWVDSSSRVPLCIKENGSTYSYKILPPPTLIHLPTEAKNYLMKRAEALKPFTTQIKHHP